jgi:hypothetical protein
MKLYDVPGVDRPLLLDEDFADELGYSEHVDDSSAPSARSSKAEWVEYAISQGADPEDASSMTKTELVDTYGV